MFLFQNKYRAKGVEAFKEYSVVTDTPVYETAKQNAENLSDVRDSINVFNIYRVMSTHEYFSLHKNKS